MLIIATKNKFYMVGKVKELKNHLKELSLQYKTVAQFLNSKLH